ncbi:MAG: YraN family protein [Firmicutes bacterium]|nr:YraN family protein [Bacillota bacterium]
MNRNNKTVGALGEDFAVSFLKRCGYRIIERNFRCRLGEIDIIAQEGNCLVFIEVKTRRSLRFGYPQEAVTLTKQAKLRRVAAYYLQRYKKRVPCRFDVLAVNIEEGTAKPELIRNAF